MIPFLYRFWGYFRMVWFSKDSPMIWVIFVIPVALNFQYDIMRGTFFVVWAALIVPTFIWFQQWLYQIGYYAKQPEKKDEPRVDNVGGPVTVSSEAQSGAKTATDSIVDPKKHGER